MLPSKIDPTPMPGFPSRARAGQATQIEQSRAIAEVQAAVTVAQHFPRSIPEAIARMKEACAIPELAEAAFFKFPRAGQSITGPSVHLARELARCWGNVTYGIKEMARDDLRGQSEMLAYAWDLETNTRPETIFIVPHLRDAKGKAPQPLTDMRDIYENNANHGARRLREQIFAVLPRWFTEQAEAACHETLQNGGGKPLAVRLSDMLKAFEGLGVSKSQIEKKIGCAVEKIDAVLLANLTITYKSLKRGELRREDEFPTEKASAIEAALKPKPALAPPPLSEEARCALSILEACPSVEDLEEAWGSQSEAARQEIGNAVLENLRAKLRSEMDHD